MLLVGPGGPSVGIGEALLTRGSEDSPHWHPPGPPQTVTDAATGRDRATRSRQREPRRAGTDRTTRSPQRGDPSQVQWRRVDGHARINLQAQQRPPHPSSWGHRS